MCHSVRLSVHLAQSVQEHRVCIFQAQIFQKSVRNKSAVSKHSESSQRVVREQSVSSKRAVREQSVSTQSIKIRVNIVGAYKYCVLFRFQKLCKVTSSTIYARG